MPETPLQPGRVSLVGAGPGHPELITLRARRLIERADVVLYDRLASPALLASMPAGKQERIHVGKGSGMQQADINRLLVARALQGQRVVRLKGGDPYVFGRGGEEAQACAEASVDFEVVPGVSSAYGALAAAGIPLTHRDHASSVTLVTGHERDDNPTTRVDWSAIAAQEGTLVVLMGVHEVEQWSQALIQAGRAPATPVAVVHWATTPQQKTLTTTLASLAADLELNGLGAPAVFVIGDVVSLRPQLEWFEKRPLHGEVVAVTRATARDVEAFQLLTELGALVVHLPLTAQRDLEAGQRALCASITAQTFTDVVLSSGNGVRAFKTALRQGEDDTRTLAGVRFWVVGPGTARQLDDELAIKADFLPSHATAEGLLELASEVGVEGRRFLFPAAAAARRVLPDGLKALGAVVDEIACYETRAHVCAAANLQTGVELGLSLVALASPSAVDSLEVALAALGLPADMVPVAAIGPTTAAAAALSGFEVAVVAHEHTMVGLASEIVSYFRSAATED